ncbi:MAG: TIGR04222 domain-containing membrane protein, partial [Acidobacteriota bacterium]
MPYRDDPLWPRLRDFPLDDAASSLPFTRRLARENLWSLGYALRVTKEYRRFLFLAMRAGHTVTPSEEVDQAWHLHRIYTRSDWDELCGEVLGRPLHHGPTRGGSEEQNRYHDLYSRTLESYEKWFEKT